MIEEFNGHKFLHGEGLVHCILCNIGMCCCENWKEHMPRCRGEVK